MVFNLAKENAKNKKIIASVHIHADDFINGIEEDVRVFLDSRGDQDAAAQAAKVKAEVSKLVDDYLDAVKKR